MKFFSFRSRRSSLLFRLLLGFLTVIVLLASLYFFSYTMYQNHIRSEIIRYNEQNIRFASERYEEHFQLIQKQMYALYFSENVTRLRNSSGNSRFELYDLVKQEITKVVGNPLMHIDNVFLVFKDNRLMVSKAGTAERSVYFEKIYTSKEYPGSFWQKQFSQAYTSRLYAASTFYENPFFETGEAISKGEFYPYVIKHWQYDDFYIVAMLDADRLYNAFHRSVNPNFIIYDQQGTAVYAKGDIPAGMPRPERKPDGDEASVLVDHTYYFTKSGGHSGFTYMNIVPVSRMFEQISQLNLILLSLLAAALLVSVFFSIMFSVRFNRPVRQIVNSIQQADGKDVSIPTGIPEFELIGRKLDDMQKTNARIEQDLVLKTTKLESYGYINKLKKIYDGPHGAGMDALSAHSFRFLVFEISYKPLFWENMQDDPDRLTYFIRECINQGISSEFPRSLTLQMENRQIVSVLSEPDDAKLEMCLESLQGMFGNDADYYFFTIAVSPVYPQSSDFTGAYEQTVRLLQERMLTEETQVVREASGRQTSSLFTQAQERQFDENLQVGNAQELLHLLDRHLSLMERKEASVRQYREFAADIVQKVRKTMYAFGLKERAAEQAIAETNPIDGLYSGRQYRMFFSRLIVASCEEIRSIRKSGDPIIEFVTEYVQTNFAQDITLDIVAEQLHITGGYLSTYFKEKTGEYFVDYINGVRIGEAKRALLETDLKIQDVALRSGYQNINSFNRMFKKFSGLSPREYRKLHLSPDTQV
ncbi:helix-turn-helix domain-containing protein [Paenibacillus sp. GYB004]|uniref:helix-turn-helix domain-containing protein n=1 Tax=Paenibacillus sp. GYB004 TaxID=2994393 RepID=UPI002F96266B